MATASEDPGFTKAEYEIKLLLHKPKFQNGVLELRKKWDIPADGLPDNKARNAWRERIDPRADEYKEDIFLLLRKLGLAERWYEGVSWYVQENMPGVLRVQPANSIRLEYDGNPLDRENVRSVWVQVDAETTEREILEAFKYARDLFGPYTKKRQPDNTDRDLAVLDLHKSGVKNTVIADYLNDNYKGDFNTDDVKKILKRIKKKLS